MPPMEPAKFDALYADMLAHMKGGTYNVQDLFGGRRPSAQPRRARCHRTGLAWALHPPHAAPARGV